MVSWARGALAAVVLALAVILTAGMGEGSQEATLGQTNTPEVTHTSDLRPLHEEDSSLSFDEDNLSYVTSHNCSLPVVARVHINPMKSAYKNWVMPKSQKEAGLLAFSFGLTAALAFTPFVCRWLLDGLFFLLGALFFGNGEEQEL
ncbi:uncharacterized protein LOC135483454 [Lineus longissimus]|uniref:uncharacterized protein LOC135483454 n=1 Tax=Lineus longissimus TaxID=88925 RepID=UPI002B4D1B9D